MLRKWFAALVCTLMVPFGAHAAGSLRFSHEVGVGISIAGLKTVEEATSGAPYEEWGATRTLVMPAVTYAWTPGHLQGSKEAFCARFRLIGMRGSLSRYSGTPPVEVRRETILGAGVAVGFMNSFRFHKITFDLGGFVGVDGFSKRTSNIDPDPYEAVVYVEQRAELELPYGFRANLAVEMLRWGVKRIGYNPIATCGIGYAVNL